MSVNNPFTVGRRRWGSLTCGLLGGVGGQEAAVGHGRVGAEQDGHGVAGGAHLCAGRYRTTEPLQARGVVHQPVQYLQNTVSNEQEVPEPSSRRSLMVSVTRRPEATASSQRHTRLCGYRLG
ncbi:hypothetical protein EYF80_028648 [Liparis tanakae]|uniref:Uncharacterized protein n=1 Tax=Liparis tanakae TaxID=230148 RepID=A0A4Z2H6J2_9TELE|nr:hypothetical protein EYF80_028648 [Liparis tanakae]